MPAARTAAAATCPASRRLLLLVRPPAGTGRLNGRSEQLLGRFLDEYPGSGAVRDNVRIATKLAAYPWRLTPKQVWGERGMNRGALAARCSAAALLLLLSCAASPGLRRHLRCMHLALPLTAAAPFPPPPPQWVGACKASLARTGQDKLALAQLHWSTAKYAPLQERLMWDGLVAIYEEVRVHGIRGGGACACVRVSCGSGAARSCPGWRRRSAALASASRPNASPLAPRPSNHPSCT